MDPKTLLRRTYTKKVMDRITFLELDIRLKHNTNEIHTHLASIKPYFILALYII